MRRLAAAAIAAGFAMNEDEPLDGYDRVYVTDPFGNCVELMQPTRQLRIPQGHSGSLPGCTDGHRPSVQEVLTHAAHFAARNHRSGTSEARRIAAQLRYHVIPFADPAVSGSFPVRESSSAR